MVRYVGRRLLQLVPVFLGATLLIYAMVFALPGDPVAALGGERGLPEAVQQQIREQYNLDEPFVVQYLLFLRGILTLDLGVTFSGREVLDVIRDALPVTFRLAIMALAFEAVLGVVLGLVAGLRRGGIFDSTVLVLSLLVIAVPTFVIGFVLQFVVGVQLGWLPVTAGSDPGFRSLLMPAAVLGAVSLAYVLRLTRTSVAENLSADYVRTARAKGLGSNRVISVHVLRNSLIPVVTFLGADLGSLMGGAIVTEGIFNINGVGGTLFRAIIQGENVTVVSLTTVLVVVYILANLLVDLLYAALDPRIRYG
ncbi:ABC transporter permease [Georgenia satyanarayanai]|uniref:ABC transporter permease n=1 Tax=Georgenia satyanarayanai TaxID=860221 RepID=UPI00203C2F8A|nr:ABC transporter permease [Georgenia satyanarayanai]MCM3662396.1 ABC transporter permease [Georgenia satyanarayanai]